jgi:hypothetical protein
MHVESHDGMILTGESRKPRKETCPNVTLSTTNPTWTDLEANLGLSVDRPATNRLSHGTVFPLLLITSVDSRSAKKRLCGFYFNGYMILSPAKVFMWDSIRHSSPYWN